MKEQKSTQIFLVKLTTVELHRQTTQSFFPESSVFFVLCFLICSCTLYFLVETSYLFAFVLTNFCSFRCFSLVLFNAILSILNALLFSSIPNWLHRTFTLAATKYHSICYGSTRFEDYLLSDFWVMWKTMGKCITWFYRLRLFFETKTSICSFAFFVGDNLIFGISILYVCAISFWVSLADSGNWGKDLWSHSFLHSKAYLKN